MTPEEMREDLERRRRQREHILAYYDLRAQAALEQLEEAQERLRKSLELRRVFSD